MSSRFLNIFVYLESFVLDTTSELHLFVLHLVYIPLINQALRELRESWNNHSLSTERNLSPMQLWVQRMISRRNSHYSAVRSVQDDLQVNWDDYGIDEDGPAANVEPNYNITVPETRINLQDEHFQHTQELVRVINAAGDQDGVICFLVVFHTLEQLGYQTES